MALKENDQRYGAENLAEPTAAQFNRSAGWRRRTRRERFDKAISVAIQGLVMLLDEDQVYRLCNGGSIWIHKDDLMCGDVDEDSFEVMGPISDPRVRKYGEEMGAYCLFDFDGKREWFVFDDSVDCDEDEIDAEMDVVVYKKNRALRVIVILIEESLEFELNNLWLQGLWLTDLGD